MPTSWGATARRQKPRLNPCADPWLSLPWSCVRAPVALPEKKLNRCLLPSDPTPLECAAEAPRAQVRACWAPERRPLASQPVHCPDLLNGLSNRLAQTIAGLMCVYRGTFRLHIADISGYENLEVNPLTSRRRRRPMHEQPKLRVRIARSGQRAAPSRHRADS